MQSSTLPPLAPPPHVMFECMRWANHHLDGVWTPHDFHMHEFTRQVYVIQDTVGVKPRSELPGGTTWPCPFNGSFMAARIRKPNLLNFDFSWIKCQTLVLCEPKNLSKIVNLNLQEATSATSLVVEMGISNALQDVLTADFPFIRLDLFTGDPAVWGDRIVKEINGEWFFYKVINNQINKNDIRCFESVFDLQEFLMDTRHAHLL